MQVQLFNRHAASDALFMKTMRDRMDYQARNDSGGSDIRLSEEIDERDYDDGRPKNPLWPDFFELRRVYDVIP